MKHNGFIEIEPGLWYEEATGLPWSSKYVKGMGTGYGTYGCYDGELKRLNAKQSGYLIVGSLKYKRSMFWHRIVWEFHNGKAPRGKFIDHKDNVRDNNKITNLHLVSNKENSRKCKIHKNNKTGFAGVSYDKQHSKFRPTIRVNGKTIHLGRFDTPEEAYQAYLAAKIKYHGPESISPLAK